MEGSRIIFMYVSKTTAYIQPLNIYFISTYYVPDTILESGDIKMSKINKVHVPIE